ncbi:MAG: CDP-alcohol phosphatidyltransferase family protein [Eubacterium sp.]|nr:CDP-alcohol phosphatidyltransferase family protein [Eubacterium sp.]
MKKQLANNISSSRILCAVGLFFFSEITSLFMTIYVYCGFSDLIDGPVARKVGNVSVLGARMDTAGDVLTYFALTKILIIQQLIPFWALLWFGITLAGFVASAVISKIRHGKFYFVHSLFGKILGGVVFILPFALKLISSSICVGIICSTASIAAIESIFIQLKSKKAQTDVISIKKLDTVSK